MVVVPVGRRDRAEQLPRALSTLLRLALGKDGDDLYLGVERDAGDLLLDQERVVDAGARLLMRHHAHPATVRAAAMPTPMSAAFQVSPSRTHR